MIICNTIYPQGTGLLLQSTKRCIYFLGAQDTLYVLAFIFHVSNGLYLLLHLQYLIYLFLYFALRARLVPSRPKSITPNDYSIEICPICPSFSDKEKDRLFTREGFYPFTRHDGCLSQMCLYGCFLFASKFDKLILSSSYIISMQVADFQ
jgi:hypothetical protein